MSTGKNIVLGVTGSIAAHKAADLASQLTKQGCEVHVVLTADALRFITAVPFKTLSRHPVVTDLYDEVDEWQPTHIKMADEADLLLIAPATANTIAKLATGIANDALSCIALALNTQARTLIAPAMNGKMWLHPARSRTWPHSSRAGSSLSAPRKACSPAGTKAWGACGPWTKSPNAPCTCCTSANPRSDGADPFPPL